MFRKLAACWLALRNRARSRGALRPDATPPVSRTAPQVPCDMNGAPELLDLLMAGPDVRAALESLTTDPPDLVDPQALRRSLDAWMDARHRAQAQCDRHCRACNLTQGGCAVERIRRRYEDLPDQG